MPKLWPLFYKLKLQTHSHKEGLILAPDTGYVRVQLRVSAFARSDAKLRAELRPRPKEQSGATTELQQYVFHHNDTELEVRVKSTSTLNSWIYVEACDKWWGAFPRLSVWAIQN